MGHGWSNLVGTYTIIDAHATTGTGRECYQNATTADELKSIMATILEAIETQQV